MTKPILGAQGWGQTLNDHLDTLLPDNGARPVGQGELILNVKNYGAVGNGTTDDTTAIAAALTAAAGTSGPTVVLLPRATAEYRVSALTIGSGVTLRGEAGVTIKKIGSSAATFIVTATSGADIRIENLTIDANGLTTSHMVRLSTGTARVTVTNCKLTDSGGVANLAGIETRDGTSDVLVEHSIFDGVDTPIFVNKNPVRCTIRNNRITNWKTRGIYVFGDATYAASDLNIERNHISGNINTSGTRQPIAFIGVDSNPFQRVRVNFNTVIGSNKSFTATDPGTADQISLHRCVDFEVIGNISRDGGDMGITIAQQCARGVVANNICINNDVGAIAFGSSTSTSVKTITATGNMAMNNGQNRNSDRAAQNRTGFYVYNATDLTLADNIFGDDQGVKTQQYGVSIWSSTGVKFSGNTWSGLNVGRLYNGGTTTGLDFGPPELPVFKTADQTVNNSTTRVSDTHLTTPVEASATYLVEAFLIFNSSTTADLNIAWALPAGATMNWVADGPASTTTSALTAVTRDALLAASNKAIGGTGANAVALPQGVLTVGSTAGSLTLQWAQNTLEVSDTKMITGSWLRLTRIA